MFDNLLQRQDVAAISDTNKPVGPVSGLAIWRLEVPAHPWGQEVAKLVWEGLEWGQVKADSKSSGNDVANHGRT